MSRYPVPAAEIRREIVVINSRFIAWLAPVFSVEQARSFIQRVRAAYPDASHHVPAYLIGHGDSLVSHCSDDGEPSGTAGRPALAVLQGSGLGDACVVVTRYFGGTKLGTGGLVRAYSDAVRAVLSEVQQAERIPTHTIMVEIYYSLLELARRAVATHQGQLLDEDFTSNVVLTVQLPTERLIAFRATMSELTNGAAQVEILETGEVLLPISKDTANNHK